jgi:hypothetical protein
MKRSRSGQDTRTASDIESSPSIAVWKQFHGLAMKLPVKFGSM